MMIRPRRAVSGTSGCIFSSRIDEARQRHLGDDLGPGAWLAVDGAMAAQQRDALVHAQQADALSRARPILRVRRAEPPSPIAHRESNKVAMLFERNRHSCSTGV